MAFYNQSSPRRIFPSVPLLPVYPSNGPLSFKYNGKYTDSSESEFVLESRSKEYSNKYRPIFADTNISSATDASVLDESFLENSNPSVEEVESTPIKISPFNAKVQAKAQSPVKKHTAVSSHSPLTVTSMSTPRSPLKTQPPCLNSPQAFAKYATSPKSSFAKLNRKSDSPQSKEKKFSMEADLSTNINTSSSKENRSSVKSGISSPGIKLDTALSPPSKIPVRAMFTPMRTALSPLAKPKISEQVSVQSPLPKIPVANTSKDISSSLSKQVSRLEAGVLTSELYTPKEIEGKSSPVLAKSSDDVQDSLVDDQCTPNLTDHEKPTLTKLQLDSEYEFHNADRRQSFGEQPSTYEIDRNQSLMSVATAHEFSLFDSHHLTETHIPNFPTSSDLYIMLAKSKILRNLHAINEMRIKRGLPLIGLENL